MSIRYSFQRMFNLYVFVCVFLGVLRISSNSISYEGQLTRFFSFDNTLPFHSSHYIKYLENIRRTECALQCILLKPACAGILYNNIIFSCKLMKCYLNEKMINGTGLDVGWEFWFQNNVCPIGWVPFNSHCYFLSKIEANWNNAKDHCEEHDAHLVEIETFEENAWILETFLLPSNDVDCFNWWNCCDCWIGATDIDSEGIFTWNRQTNVTFSNWKEFQPDNLFSAHCVRFCRSGFWDDENCNTNIAFVCEKE